MIAGVVRVDRRRRSSSACSSTPSVDEVARDRAPRRARRHPAPRRRDARAVRADRAGAVPAGVEGDRRSRSSRDVERLDVWPVEAILLDAPTPGRGGAGARVRSRARPRGARAPSRAPASCSPAGSIRQRRRGDRARSSRGPSTSRAASRRRPGVKDAAKVAAFVAAVRGAAMTQGRAARSPSTDASASSAASTSPRR